MPLLSDSELADLRATAATALPGTAIVMTQAWTSDGGGGGSVAWTASGTVDCRVAPVGGYGASEGQTGGRISPDAEFIITLPASTTVDTNARLVIDGDTFNVEAVRDRSWNVTTRVEAKKAP